MEETHLGTRALIGFTTGLAITIAPFFFTHQGQLGALIEKENYLVTNIQFAQKKYKHALGKSGVNVTYNNLIKNRERSMFGLFDFLREREVLFMNSREGLKESIDNWGHELVDIKVAYRQHPKLQVWLRRFLNAPMRNENIAIGAALLGCASGVLWPEIKKLFSGKAE